MRFRLFIVLVVDDLKTAKLFPVAIRVSGFGFQLAIKCNLMGFHVFAGVLLPDTGGAIHLKSLCSDRLKVVKMDVTNEDEIANVIDLIKKSPSSALGCCQQRRHISSVSVLLGTRQLLRFGKNICGKRFRSRQSDQTMSAVIASI
jgi:hypothetical protein